MRRMRDRFGCVIFAVCIKIKLSHVRNRSVTSADCIKSKTDVHALFAAARPWSSALALAVARFKNTKIRNMKTIKRIKGQHAESKRQAATLRLPRVTCAGDDVNHGLRFKVVSCARHVSADDPRTTDERLLSNGA